MRTLKEEYRSLLMEIILYLISFLFSWTAGSTYPNPPSIFHISNVAYFLKVQFNHQLLNAILDFLRIRGNLPLNFFNNFYSTIFKYITTFHTL